MINSTFSIRVIYADTDQMGYVYYGNYAKYFEVGRVELFRSIGLSYKELEDSGVMMPVLNLNIKYVKPAYYDDTLTILTKIKEIPTGTRINFEYEIQNQHQQTICIGTTQLVFVNIQSKRPTKCPLLMQKRLEQHIKNSF